MLTGEALNHLKQQSARLLRALVIGIMGAAAPIAAALGQTDDAARYDKLFQDTSSHDFRTASHEFQFLNESHMKTNAWLLPALLTVCCLTGFIVNGALAADPAKPSILFIVADDYAFPSKNAETPILGLDPLPKSHEISLKPILKGQPNAKGHDFIFAEISNRGPLPNDGMQERSVFDGRWKLIDREKLTPPWRQVQADSKQWKPWGNRTYAETVRVKEQFPEAFRILAEMDPQSLGGKVAALQLYDLHSDPDEMRNLADRPAASPHRDRLYAALCRWVQDTADPAVQPPPVPKES